MIYQRKSAFHVRDRDIALTPLARDTRPVLDIRKVALWAVIGGVPWVVIVLAFLAIGSR